MANSLIFYLITIFVIFVNCDKTEEEEFLVIGPNGVLHGELRDYFIAFEGIPYAEPPIGENRFALPKPLTKQWNGIRNATKPGEVCMQWDHILFEGDKLHGSEDCLFLNIFTPIVKSVKKYPVILYIHGGAFMFGNSDYYWPDILMKRPIIFISINYRVGPLGFLSTEDSNIPGNMGLKDQSFALKWVKENIERFGGDSNKITITGYSAGGASVHLHYLSPLSTGLFTNGISHSGSALNPWVFTENPVEKAKKLAEHLGCPTCCNIRMTECLKQKPAEDIVRAVKLFQPWLYNPFTPFGPVIEPVSDHAFLSESPLQILEQGKFQQIPWLASSVESEGLYPGGEFLRDPKYLQELETRWNELAPFILDFNGTVPLIQQEEVADLIRKHYLKNELISETTFPSLIKMITDRLYLIGIHKAIKLQAKNSNAPVYYYYYKFKAAEGLAQYLSNRIDFNFGVSHGDDVFLILKTNLRTQYTSDELIMQNNFINMYYNYADSGQLEFGNVILEAVQKDTSELQYLEIINSQTFAMNAAENLGEEDFWETIPYN